MEERLDEQFVRVGEVHQRELLLLSGVGVEFCLLGAEIDHVIQRLAVGEPHVRPRFYEALSELERDRAFPEPPGPWR